MKLSIVIPCFNEKATILELIDAVRSAPIQDKQIIIVDDGSSDGTRETLRGVEDQGDLDIIYHEKNRGKGGETGGNERQRTGGIDTDCSHRL